jgi:hypothetical protein
MKTKQNNIKEVWVKPGKMAFAPKLDPDKDTKTLSIDADTKSIISDLKELKQSYDDLNCFAADFWDMLVQFASNWENKIELYELISIADDYFRDTNSLNKTAEQIRQQLDQVWETEHARHRKQ